jgi:uncharacterized membrane protein YbhN (UPF0104 family)
VESAAVSAQKMTENALLSPRWTEFLRSGRLRLAWSVIGTLLVVLAAIVALRSTSLSEIGAALGGAHPGWLAVTAGTFALGQLLRILRARIVLRAVAEPVTTGTVAQAVLVGQVVNWLSPVRVGDIWRVLKTSNGRVDGAVSAITALIAEKSSDAVILAVIAIVVGALAMPAQFASPVTRLLVTATGGFLAVSAISMLTSTRMQDRMLRLLPAGKIGDLTRTVSNAIRFRSVVSLRRTLFTSALWTWPIWLMALLSNAALLRAFNLSLSVPEQLLLMLAIQSSLIFSPVPGNVGVFSLVAVGVFSQLGIGEGTAIAFGVALWALSYGVMALCCITALGTADRSGNIRQTVRQPEQRAP